MGLANYRIFGAPGEWRIEHDGNAENTYVTKEAAFEAAVGAASLALRQGHQVVVTAPGSDGDNATTGARETR
jgi:phosphotransferase system HPr-like phosphotransfer protein